MKNAKATRAINAAVTATINAPPPQTIDLAVAAPSERRKRDCAAQHFGAWAINARWLAQAADAVRAGTWVACSDPFDAGGGDDDYAAYEVTDGVAVIEMSGQITKYGSSFGGCSSVETRAALRGAERDGAVKSILLKIDSPGGTVSGTAELAAEVQRVRATKPVYAHVDDMACSAAYWVASQCERITANVSSVVGCIGTYCVLEDTTGLQDRAGVKLRVVSTGPYKGLGADGAVGAELVADVQREVNEVNQPFLDAVASGRNADPRIVMTWADGRSHAAAQAQAMGLIDAVMTCDAAIVAASAPVPPPGQPAATNKIPPAARRGSGQPAPLKAGKHSAAAPGGERSPMNEKKRAYLESLGLRTDATDAEAETFYSLLNSEKQAAADAAETDAAAAPTTPPPAPAMPPAAASLSDMLVACDGDKATAFDYLGGGLSVAQARAAYASVKTAKSDAKAARDEAAAANRKLGAVKLGNDPVGFQAAADKDAAPAAPKDPKKLANKLGSNIAKVASSIKLPSAPANPQNTTPAA